MEPYRIVVADDHTLLRELVASTLKGREGLAVVGEAADGEALLQVVTETTPDLVVLDVSMPRLSGLEAVGTLRTRHPGVRILMLTAHEEKEFLSRAVAGGVHGYLLKHEDTCELLRAVETVQGGGFYLSPLLAATVQQDWLERCRTMRRSPPDVLTDREKQVLRLVAEGRSSRQAAETLCISIRTVERHRANLMAKLRIRKSTELVRYALARGHA